MTVHEATSTEPLVKKVTVPTTPVRAFEVFTAETSAWWPLVTHSIGQDTARRVEFGAGIGGQIVEYGEDGVLGVWGTVSEWDPPDRVAFSWHPGYDESGATLVTVTFAAVADGTEVVLTHSDWQNHPRTAEARAGYDTGWIYVLDHYAAQIQP
jgi:Activator of Hsp90 ATPase homolog 1-like protein